MGGPDPTPLFSGGAPGTDAFPRARVRRALQERRLRVAYQPIVRLDDGTVAGHEALARMTTPQGALLDAAAFIHVAAGIGLESRIDADITAQAMAQAAVPGPAAAARGKLFMNCSSAFLCDSGSLDALLQHHRTWLDAQPAASTRDVPWVIEITERNLDACPRRLRSKLDPLLEQGFALALDDFGSNHSAFPYLLNLPVRYLKFDRELIRAAPIASRARVTLGHLKRLAGDLGMTTVAEGVEDRATLDCVRDLGIDLGQGYWWARPTPG